LSQVDANIPDEGNPDDDDGDVEAIGSDDDEGDDEST